MSITFLSNYWKKSGSKTAIENSIHNSCEIKSLYLANEIVQWKLEKCTRFHVKLSKHKPISNVQNYTGSDISSQFPRSSTLVNRIKPSQAINTTYHPKKARQGAWNATNAVSVKRKNANTAGSKYNQTLTIAQLGNILTLVRPIWSLDYQIFAKSYPTQYPTQMVAQSRCLFCHHMFNISIKSGTDCT